MSQSLTPSMKARRFRDLDGCRNFRGPGALCLASFARHRAFVAAIASLTAASTSAASFWSNSQSGRWDFDRTIVLTSMRLNCAWTSRQPASSANRSSSPTVQFL